jgi:hypothetical protein
LLLPLLWKLVLRLQPVLLQLVSARKRGARKGALVALGRKGLRSRVCGPRRRILGLALPAPVERLL